MMRRADVGVATVVVTVAAAVAASLFSTPQAEYMPQGGLQSGEELLLVFVGASSCGAHRRQGFAEVVEAAKKALADRAQREGHSFAAVGVALDWAAEDGLTFLRAFGQFDELLVGRNWLNTGAIKYIWKELPGRAAIPQVLVVRRRIQVGRTGITVSHEELLLRRVGVHAILAWADVGFAI